MQESYLCRDRFLNKEHKNEDLFLTKEDELWEHVIDYTRHCSWIAGKGLAYVMEQDAFRDW